LVELLRALGSGGRRDDAEHGVEIARAAAGPGQALAGEAELLPAVRAGGHLHARRAVERRHLDLRPERRFPGRDRDLDVEIVAARSEQGMGLEHDVEVQVARRAAVRAGTALAGEAQALAV